MNDSKLKKIERILCLIFILLGVVVVGGILLMLRFNREDKRPVAQTTEEAGTETDYDWEAGLSDSTVWLPDNCNLYEKLPDFTIEDEAGNEHHISEFQGKKTILVFWASWCTDCNEQMPHMKEFEKLAAAYDDIQFVYINKTDGTKETKASAKVYYDELGFDEPIYYDVDLYAYNSLGMHNIPTTFFVDENGTIISWSPKQITENKMFEAYIDNLVNGNSAATYKFVSEQLMDENGGVHSSYDASVDVTAASDVLSESQGLMMLYAVQRQDKQLYDRLLKYTAEHMLGDGLAAWKVSDKEVSRVNALLDDFRIYRSLSEAQELWGGYESNLADYEKCLLEFGIEDDRYVDFYDAKNKQKADRLTLCYIDLATMEQLAKHDETMKNACDNARTILTEGQISEAFPLYYSWYDYGSKKYQEDELNMAEAMVTLLHLAQNDMLPENTVEWLKAQMSGGGIKARMSVDGKVVSGYNYDSTAVYALVALIGDETGDSVLRGQALRRMEKMRIHDIKLPYNGAFGMEDGSDIQSFDQLLPLTVYSQLETKQE